MNLFEIDAQIAALIDDNGEIADFDAFEELALERNAKIENTALYIVNLRAEAAALGDQRKKFAEREKAAKDKADRLEEYLDRVLAGEKFKTTRVAVSYRKSERAIVDDFAALPVDFLRIKDPEADLTAIKAAIKAGTEVPGAHIEEAQNISIK